jgi:hypothetical protein
LLEEKQMMRFNGSFDEYCEEFDNE